MRELRRKSTNRRGVSLLEILICVGILSIGLLGVAALIPAGHFAVVETTKADRSVACANAAKAELQVRGMLKPEDSWWIWGAGPLNPGTYENFRTTFKNHNQFGPVMRGRTIMLDPLGVTTALANSVAPATMLYFPYEATTIPNKKLLWRFTSIDDDPATNAWVLPYINRIHQWSDDVVFEDSDDPDQRPRQMFTFSGGGFGPYPGTAGTPILSEYNGDYSWFLTITPLNDRNDIVSGQNVPKPASELENFEVSTVICYKRDLSFDTTADIPAERLAYIEPTLFAGIAGAGASDIPLMTPTNVSNSQQLEYLDVKPGQWIMLVGDIRDANLDYLDTSGTPQPGRRRIAKWYRILSVDDAMSDGPDREVRWVTVTGPEWIPNTANGPMIGTQAVIVDSVIGVFTETMTADR